MAKNREAQIKFTAETGEFNSQIQKANSTLTELRAELKLNETQMKATGTTAEGLQNKHKILSGQLEAAASKTEALSNKLDAAVRIYGEGSAEVSKWKTQLTNAQTAQAKLEQAVAQCSREIDDFERAASEAGNETEKLTDTVDRQEKELKELKTAYVDAVLQYGKGSDEAKRLAREIKDLSSELKENQTALNKAESAADKLDKSLDNAGDAAKDAGDGFTVLKGTVADLASEAIQMAIGKISEFIGYLKELPEATRELRQDFATLETSFDTAGLSTEQATNTWKELYKVFGEDDRAVEAANLISKMSDSQKDLNDWVNITTGVWGSYQDSLPVEGLAESSNETAKVGKVTGNLADALNWSSEAATMFAKYMSEDVTTAEDAFNVALSECSTEQERQQLIVETLTALYGDAAEKYREVSGGQLAAKEAAAELAIAEAEVAEAIEPWTAAMDAAKAEMLTALVPAIEKVSSLAISAMDWMKEHPTLTKAIATAVGVLAVGITGLVIGITAWTAAQWLLNASLLPVIGIAAAVVAGIALLSAIIVAVVDNWDSLSAAAGRAWEFIKTKWGEFSSWFSTSVIDPTVNFFKGLWDNITNGASAAWEGIKSFFAAVPGWFDTNVVQPVLNFFTGLWNGMKAIWDTICNVVQVGLMLISEIISAAVQIITLPFMFIWENCKEYVFAAWEWIKTKVSAAVNAVKNTITTVWKAVKNVFTTVWNAIKGVVGSVWDWIKSKVTTATNAVKGVVTNVWNAVKSVTTTVWNAVKSFVTSVWNNIKSVVSSVANSVKSVISAAWNAIKNATVSAYNSVKSSVSSAWNSVKSVVSNAVNSVKSSISNAWNNVKSTTSSAFNSIKSTVSSIWNGIKNSISNAISGAVSAVKNGVSRLKSALSFNWSLPKLKMPHFSISGKFSLNPPSVPKFSVQWYKQAMGAPMILTRPTIFGYANGRFLGGGEAGNEMIGGVNTVSDMIQNAVYKAMGAFNVQALAESIQDLADRPIELNINGRQFALATASDGDSVNGLRSSFKNRGLIVD